MAYLFWKNDHAYIYHKGKCRKALGVVGARDADQELSIWKADHGLDDDHPEDRSMEVVWQDYLNYLVANDYSPKTIRSAETSVGPFVRTLKKLSNLTPEACDAWDKVLQAWVFKKGANGKERILSTETRAHRLRAISAFCGWLTEEKKYFKHSPFEVKIPEQRKDAGRALQGNQVHALFDHWPTGRNSVEKRGLANLAKLFFQMKFYGGFRISELLGYDDANQGAIYEHLDRVRCFLTLGKTKAGEPREIALPKPIIDKIPKGTGPIFYGLISERTLRHYLMMALRSANITGRFRPHDARVTAATEWARVNQDTKSSMDQFGWTTEKMALHYQKVATKRRVQQAQNITYK